MRRILYFMAAALVVVAFTAPVGHADDYWEGIIQPPGSHPWGGDNDGGGASGDGFVQIDPSPQPDLTFISITGYRVIDVLIFGVIIQPMYEESVSADEPQRAVAPSYADRKAARRFTTLER